MKNNYDQTPGKKKILSGFIIAMMLHLFSAVLFNANAQTPFVISTTSLFTNNNGSGQVTFNFQNTNSYPVIITGLDGVTGASGTQTCELWYKTTPISGSPGAISVANGWNIAMSGSFTGVANTSTTVPQTYISGGTFVVPAGATYGFSVAVASQRYYTITPAGSYTLSAGGCNMLYGTNVSYGGGSPPSTPGNTPRGWIGNIYFVPALRAGNDAGVLSFDAPTSFSTGSNNIIARVKNFGVNRINSVNVNWSVNGVTQTPVSLNSILIDTVGGSGSNTLPVTLGSVTFANNVTYRIKAWTSLPNTITDTVPLNDSSTLILRSPLCGNYNVGVGGDFTTITDAVSTLSAAGISCPVTFTLLDNYYSGRSTTVAGPSTGETFPINIANIAGSSAVNTITFKPSATSTPLIFDSLASGPMFIIDNTKYVFIDGRQFPGDPNRNITIENMSTAGSCIKYQNDAIGCSVRNCNIRGANSSYTYTSGSGLITIAGTNKAIPYGNDSISIINNVITRSQNIRFGVGIASQGQSTFATNDNITIDSNLIYGYIGVTAYPSAISVTGTGNGSNFKIRWNALYDTAVITGTTMYAMNIYFVPGALSNNNLIIGNVLGGNSPYAPEGVYGNRLVFAGTSSGAYYGIYTSVGSGSGITIADNRIRNLCYYGTSSMSFYNFYNVGGTTVTGYPGHGNIIGSLTDTNSINVSGTGATYGFYQSTGNNLSVEDNVISNIRWGASSTNYGYYIGSSGAVASVNNNRIRAYNLTGTSSATLYGFYIGSSNQNQTFSNNNIGGPALADSLSITSTSAARIIGYYLAGSGNTVFTSNRIQNIFSYYPSSTAGTGATIMGIYIASSYPYTISNNIIDNLRSYGLGTSGLVGIYASAGNPLTITNDTITNLYANSSYTSSGATAAINGITVSGSISSLNITNNLVANIDNYNASGFQVNGIYCFNQSTSATTNIANNIVRNIRNNSTYASGGIIGINNGATSSYPNQVITGNTVHSLSSYDATAGSVSIYGIVSNTSTALTGNNSSVTKNNIHSFNAGTGTGNATIYGIFVGSGSSLYANNMIRLGRDTAGALIARPATIKGIYQASSGALVNRYLHNTVYIEAAPTTGTQITSAFELLSQPTAPGLVDVRNNIFVNNSNNLSGSATGNHYVVRYPANPTPLASIANINTDFNIYNSFSSANNFVGQSGATNLLDLPAIQSTLMRDGSSGFDAAIALQNVTGDYSSVNLRLAASNKAEGAGDSTVMAYVSDDIDGNARTGRTPTDIGASSGNYTSTGDVNAPGIIYTPLVNTTSITDRVISVNVFDKGGLPIGSFAPRVYFKKGISGTWGSTTGVLASGNRFNGNWNMTISNAIMGGVTAGDTVYYFVAAQDSTVGNFNANAMYASGSSVLGITTYPSTPNSYFISAPFASTVTVGPGGTYNSFTETGAGGFFQALNNGSLSSNITALVTGNITETGAVQLNPWLESGAGNYTLTIRPQFNTQVIISGNTANTNGMIRLSGVNRVNILGWSPTGTNADTNLVIRSMLTNMPALGFINGGGYDSLMNVIFESRNSSTGTVYVNPTSVTTGLSNVLFNGCHFRQDMSNAFSSFPYSGFYAAGTAPRFNNNIWFINNQFYNFSSMGLYITGTGNGNGWIINNNHFYQNALATWTSTMYGIYFTPGSTSDNNTIINNWIGGQAAFTGSNQLQLPSIFYGIYASSGLAGGTIINNNVIANINFTAANTSTEYLIYVTGTGAKYVVNGNRIGHSIPALSVNSAGNQRIYSIYSTATGNVTITNDTIMNITNANAGGSAVGISGIHVTSGSANTTIIDNNYIRGLFVTSANTGAGYAGTGSINGIYLGSSSLNQSITNNTIQTLVNYNATAAYQIIGICQYSSGSVNILNNMIYGISSKANSSASGYYTSSILGISSYSSTSNPQNISGNTIDSIWLVPTTVNTSQITGIFNYSPSVATSITNNTIRNMNTTSSNANTFYNSSIVGINMYYSSGTINGNISNNRIYNLQNWHTTSAHAIVGIHFYGVNTITGNNTMVNGNFIHSFKSASTNTPRFDGIYVLTATQHSPTT